ncbi:MAG: AAA family ATPase, partial [Nitrospirota bacterium]|nr:AAA family ATPase [Nitrospirota bacterium]
MRIEKLELIGFKSFADKTTFVLHPGITCIVGPNGCGKSNVVDAFRWVLGEQSAKSLRGEKMEEVICGGSLSKKQKGMAEVAMIISGLNGGGNGQGQGDDVTITRRLYRSGESEYMLNKNQCRLRDIKDLFLDTGLEVRSYSILEQGRIGEILNSKPFERRFIIEEVAGVMKYKVRKAEALSKLESSRLNLSRVTDIITEVRKQINILDRLARKAERYKKLSSEMHSIELKIARKEYQRIKESHGRILEELEAMREKEAFQRAEIAGIENTTEARRVELLEKEKHLELIQKKYQVMERDISGIESAIAISKNDISNIAEYQEKIIQQEEEADSRIAEISARCEELRGISTRMSGEMEADIEVLREKTEFLGAIEEALSEKEELIEDKRKEIFRITEELSNLRNELGRQQSLLESLEKREISAVRESEDSRKILDEIESSINSHELAIHGRANEVLLLKEKKDVLTQELSDARNRLEGLIVLLSGAREDIASYASRLDSLKEIVFDSPTRDLLSSNENIRLLASISEVMEVDAEFEKAIESALADKTDSFILDSTGSIEIAISALKGKEAGRTAFITPAAPRASSGRNVPEGVIGRGPDFVVVKEEYSGIAENLLGSVLIVRDIKTAFELGPLDGSYTFATLDGEVIEPSGSVIAGEGRGIFKRR